GTFPATERLSAGPGSRGGTGSLVHVADSGLDFLKEAIDLFLLLAEEPRGQTILCLVCLGQRFIEAPDLTNGKEGHEQLLEEERALQRQCGDGRRHEVTLVEYAAFEPLATGEDFSFSPGLLHRALPPVDRLCVDHRSEVHVLLGYVSHDHRLG